MARFLQIFAVLCALAVFGLWFGLGKNTGWSKNEIVTMKLDPITEISYPETKPGFVPGVDFLAAGLIGSGLIFAVGLAISRFKPKPKTL